MFCASGKEMGAPTGNWLYDSARELTEMASTQFAVYGLMNPYTYQRPKITPLPDETGLTVPGGTGVAVVPNGTAPAVKPPYLPGQYPEYPAAVQGWAQQALPGGGSSIEGGSKAIDNAIPNVESATINPKKLTEYALNPNHPVGGNKAKVFESALGYNQSNADDLMRQIYEKLPSSEAVVGKLDQYGQRYTVDIPIMGPNGNTVNVRTGWITKTGSDIPELTTIYVKD